MTKSKKKGAKNNTPKIAIIISVVVALIALLITLFMVLRNTGSGNETGDNNNNSGDNNNDAGDNNNNNSGSVTEGNNNNDSLTGDSDRAETLPHGDSDHVDSDGGDSDGSGDSDGGDGGGGTSGDTEKQYSNTHENGAYTWSFVANITASNVVQLSTTLTSSAGSTETTVEVETDTGSLGWDGALTLNMVPVNQFERFRTRLRSISYSSSTETLTIDIDYVVVNIATNQTTGDPLTASVDLY